MKILHNGSKFAGEPNDTLDLLLERLQKHPLEPFSSISKYSGVDNEKYLVMGNFVDLSAVFHLLINKSEVSRWRQLFRKNRQKFTWPLTGRHGHANNTLHSLPYVRSAFNLM